MNTKPEMALSSLLSNSNGAYIEELYLQFKDNPDSIEPAWQKFFEGYELGLESAGKQDGTFSDLEVAVMKLINAYRARGHLIADTNPVRPRRHHEADLNLSYFGLTEADLDKEVDVGDQVSLGRTTIGKIIEHLQKTYCGSIGVEYRNNRNSSLRSWMIKHMEPSANRPDLKEDERRHILQKLAEAVGFEKFLGIKYVGQKRFSLEGCESFIPALDAIFNEGASLGVKEFNMGMAHRGRLNVLVNLFGRSYEQMFAAFEGNDMADDMLGDGDVKYHQGQSDDIVTRDGHELHLSLAFNPSHLEAVDPVVLGTVKAKGERLYDGDNSKICPVIVHGDAAISGQGVVYEVANMRDLEGFDTGGTIHIVINNQVGFTANYRETRSSLYCTDIAKVTESPVFHVNADDVEAVVHAAKMAIQLRQKFGIDVYIDILGYRRFGHNESDDPQFTQPLLYENIREHPTVLQLYSQHLLELGIIDEAEVESINNDFRKALDESLQEARDSKPVINVNYFGRLWRGYRPAKLEDFNQSPPTGVRRHYLIRILDALVNVPEGFHIYPKLRRLIDHRRKLGFDDKEVDWGMAELMAYGSLLMDNVPVRLTGQDSCRGTFAHRHSKLIDFTDETEYIPINHITKAQEKLSVYNSHLSEYAVMGFEYGYSLAVPDGLCIWEAQFGDFANGAQIIIDQFLSSSESKWQRMSGLVLLLPHGDEGQGPEHSSARLGRFLDLCAELNIIVVNPSTAANFFHLIRRQVKMPFRKPLIVMTPKSMLRNPQVRSPLSELENGCFKEIIDDELAVDNVDRVLLCSGKIYYELLEYREKKEIENVAIVRIEQFYPVPVKQDKALLKKYAGKELYWVQEEPENMGARQFIETRFQSQDLHFVSKPESASPAPGAMKAHLIDQQELIEKAFDFGKGSK